MPCDSYIAPQQTKKERDADVKAALARLEAAVAAGTVVVKVGPQGALAFTGWSGAERAGITDVCAYRKLSAANSPTLRKAIARAEVSAGRKIDPRQIASGVHEHDGKWYPGH